MGSVIPRRTWPRSSKCPKGMVPGADRRGPFPNPPPRGRAGSRGRLVRREVGTQGPVSRGCVEGRGEGLRPAEAMPEADQAARAVDQDELTAERTGGTMDDVAVDAD